VAAGQVVGLAQSAAVIARERLPNTTFVKGDALARPFADDSFERVVAMTFYRHVEPCERAASSPSRVAPDLIVVDEPCGPT
jgi:ubiquinone/menaquinone biosynthesis C-methylase UbiE